MSNSGLRELLNEYADEARTYDVRAKALATGRRHRRMRRIAPALVAVVLLVGVVGIVTATGDAHSTRSEPAPVGSEPSVESTDPTAPVAVEGIVRGRITLDGYPASIPLATSMPPPLPTDRAVGLGLALYYHRTFEHMVLVCADGAQYRLGGTETSFQLSPDRRWLTSDNHNFVSHLRDLTGVERPGTDVAGVVAAWDPAVTWVATRTGDGHTTSAVTVTSLTTFAPGKTTDLNDHLGWSPVSVTANGNVVLVKLNTGTDFAVSIVDSAGPGPTYRVDLKPWLTPSELRAKQEMDLLEVAVGTMSRRAFFTTDGLVYVQLMDAFPSPDTASGEGYYAHDVLVLDVAGQKVKERISMPTPKPFNRPTDGDRESWILLGVRSDGLLVQHRTLQRALAWELYNPTTHELFPVTDITALAAKS